MSAGRDSGRSGCASGECGLFSAAVVPDDEASPVVVVVGSEDEEPGDWTVRVRMWLVTEERLAVATGSCFEALSTNCSPYVNRR